MKPAARFSSDRSHSDPSLWTIPAKWSGSSKKSHMSHLLRCFGSIVLSVMMLAGMLLPKASLSVKAAEDYTTTFEFGEDYFIWNDPPDYCQWDANRWPGNKWGGNWQTRPLADSGSLIGDVSCTIFSTCDAISALLGIRLDPGDEAEDAYRSNYMSAGGSDYNAAMYLAKKHDISYEKIDYTAVADALKKGQPVVAFTKGSVFSAGEHAICLFGYYEGRTLVRDPSHPVLWKEVPVGGKWYELDYIEQYNPNHAYVALGDGLPDNALVGLRSQFMEDILNEADYQPADVAEIEKSVEQFSLSCSALDCLDSLQKIQASHPAQVLARP